MAFYGKTSGEWQKLSSLETNKTVSIVTGESGSTGAIRRLNPDGSSENWVNTNHGDSVSDLDIDSDLNIYSSSNDGSIRKFDSTGVEQWQFTQSVNFSSIAVSDAGGVYVGDDSGIVTKINKSTGIAEWTFTHSGTVNGMYADQNGNAFSAASDDTVRKIDPEGNQMWVSTAPSGTLLGIVSGGGDHVYTSDFNNVTKIGPNGSKIWSSSITSRANDLAINETTGTVYVADGGGAIHKIENDTGTKVFDENVVPGGGPLNTLSVDRNGFIYGGSDGPTFVKVEDTGSSFSQVWEYTLFNNSVQASSIKTIT